MFVDGCSQEKGWLKYFDFYIYDAETFTEDDWQD